jgi:septal ring factor EnvC (AmiA/AmiB activator)
MDNFDFIKLSKEAGIIGAILTFLGGIVVAVLKFLPDYRRAEGEKKKAEIEAETSSRKMTFEQLMALVDTLEQEVNRTKRSCTEDIDRLKEENELMQDALQILQEKHEKNQFILDEIRRNVLNLCPNAGEVCQVKSAFSKLNSEGDRFHPAVV